MWSCIVVKTGSQCSSNLVMATPCKLSGYPVSWETPRSFVPLIRARFHHDLSLSDVISLVLQMSTGQTSSIMLYASV